MFIGLIVGAIIRYTFSITTVSHIDVLPNTTIVNHSVPPDEVWLWFPVEKKNKTFSYKFHGEVTDLKNNDMDLKVLMCFIFYQLC